MGLLARCWPQNFGLHDLPKTTPPLLDLYESQMDNITKILVGSGAKNVLYALTTPFEADHAPGCGPYVSSGSGTIMLSSSAGATQQQLA